MSELPVLKIVSFQRWRIYEVFKEIIVTPGKISEKDKPVNMSSSLSGNSYKMAYQHKDTVKMPSPRITK
jgi:hypothetical protein